MAEGCPSRAADFGVIVAIGKAGTSMRTLMQSARTRLGCVQQHHALLRAAGFHLELPGVIYERMRSMAMRDANAGFQVGYRLRLGATWRA